MNHYVYELEEVDLVFKEVGRTSILYSHGTKKKRKGTWRFKALDNISVKIEKGRTIGLIGRNGAGKTTLLRVLAGIYAPDRGHIIVNSDSVSLLSLGLGFDNYATGIDNIYLSSLLQGHPKSLVEEKLDEIIEFADIGDFINSPVKTYSSGMRMRLAFSIAVHFKPDVLLIDEALSVGDIEFQKKSTNKMNELIQDKNRTVIIASHSMNFLKTVSDEIIWMEKGKVAMMGEPEKVINSYIAFINEQGKKK